MAFANRGEFAEKKVKEHLELWHVVTDRREYARLVDTKAAGRIIKAADADFAYYCHDLGTLAVHGLIEVKETEHLYRLARDKVSQLPRLRKREKCGGRSVVLVYHSVSKQWRALTVEYLVKTGDKGSWNLTEEPTFPTAAEALRHFNPEVFRL
jgi:hypothetical protein